MIKTEASANDSQWLSEEIFSIAYAALPLVSIDLMVTRPSHQGLELLLGLRNNLPAQGWWFTPGGRIRKNESLTTALRRLAHDEIGLNHDWLSRAQLLGAWDHFYPDSAFDADVSTHYVNLPHALHLTEDEAKAFQPLSGQGLQHKTWMWMSVAQANIDERVHEYVRLVLPGNPPLLQGPEK
jgi:colanic acid biosynthesis protein WcaH